MMYDPTSLADILRPVADVDRWLGMLCGEGFVRSSATQWRDYVALCTSLMASGYVEAVRALPWGAVP